MHRRLSEAEWLLLRESGIPAAVAHERLLGWDGEHITIPVFSYDRRVLFFERATWGHDDLLELVPKRGGRVALYGAQLLRQAPGQVILTEGVVESLVLAGKSFLALSATGSGRAFNEEWVPLLRGLREVFICFRHGEGSQRRAEQIAFLIPQATVVALPEEVGEGGGVADFFVRLGRTRLDFLRLLSLAGYA
ncbi:MAG TPA: hypothetical protein VN493_06000 [Thermoanaerobaculia bacterium]|nr:hypothetical protein [Thermoanaerobaculia bacterium]